MNGRDRDTAALVALQYTERISARKRDALIRRLPVPSELFTEEGATLLRTLSPEAADEFKAVSERIDGVFDALERAGASWVTCLDDEFPELLREIEPMPAALFVKGSVSALGGFALGVVGTRKPTRYGLKLADMFAREFARAGITVVSGFARGVDTAAHKACIEGGAPTVAVFGCGVDICYPGENRALYDAIIGGGGAVVSEYPLSTKPVGYHFPERNRLISGLSRGIFLPVLAGEGVVAEGQLVGFALRIAPCAEKNEKNHENAVDEHVLDDHLSAAGKLFHAAPPASPRSAARARSLSAWRRHACSTRAREMMA